MHFKYIITGYTANNTALGWCIKNLGFQHLGKWNTYYVSGTGDTVSYMFKFKEKADCDLFKTEFMLRFG